MGKSGSFPPLNPALGVNGLDSRLHCSSACWRSTLVSQELMFKHRYFYHFDKSPTHHMGESLCVLSTYVINFVQSERAPKKAQVGTRSKPVALAIP